MYAVGHSIHVRRPVEDVFKVICDLPSLPDWFVGMEKWEPIGPAHASAGDRYQVLMKVGSIATGGQVILTEVSEPRLIAWKSEAGTQHTVRFTLEPEGDGCRAAIELAFELSGAVSSRITELISGGMVRRRLDASLERLRHHCEFEI